MNCKLINKNIINIHVDLFILTGSATKIRQTKVHANQPPSLAVIVGGINVQMTFWMVKLLQDLRHVLEVSQQCGSNAGLVSAGVKDSHALLTDVSYSNKHIRTQVMSNSSFSLGTKIYQENISPLLFSSRKRFSRHRIFLKYCLV